MGTEAGDKKTPVIGARRVPVKKRNLHYWRFIFYILTEIMAGHYNLFPNRCDNDFCVNHNHLEHVVSGIAYWMNGTSQKIGCNIACFGPTLHWQR